MMHKTAVYKQNTQNSFNTCIPNVKAALLNSIPSLYALHAMHPAKQTACTNVQNFLLIYWQQKKPHKLH